jgi:hypothetical protein
MRGRWTLPQGVRTEVIRVSITAGRDIAEYDPAADMDLYEHYLAEPHYSVKENPNGNDKPVSEGEPV